MWVSIIVEKIAVLSRKELIDLHRELVKKIVV